MAGRVFTLDVSDDGATVTTVETQPHDVVPLLVPQQGGFVIWAGVRLFNFDPTRVTLSGEIKDPVTGNALSGRDTRQAKFALDTPADGFASPIDLDTFSTIPNIPACPDFLGHGALGPAILEIVATDLQQKTATFDIAVTPACTHASNHDFCTCVCGPDYVEGRCGQDGGAAADARGGD